MPPPDQQPSADSINGMRITAHTSPCQHVREYFHATATGADDVPLQLHIKRYIPADDGQPADAPRKGMTIIAAAANAVPKVCRSSFPATCTRERRCASRTAADARARAHACMQEAYEPVWEALFARLKAAGVAVNSLWMADPANQGASGVANEGVLGDDRKPVLLLLFCLWLRGAD